MSVPMAVSLAQLKTHLNKVDVEGDAGLAAIGAAATRQAEFYCGPIIQRTITERVRSTGTLRLSYTPVVAVTSVLLPDGSDPHPGVVYDIDLDAGLVTYPLGWLQPGLSFVVTYVAGMATSALDVPEDITEAVCIIARHLWATQRGRSLRPESRGGPDDQAAPAGFAIPNRAVELLAPYRSVRIA